MWLGIGALLTGLLSAGLFLILDGFALDRGAALAMEVTFGVLAFLAAIALAEPGHRDTPR